MMKRFYQIGNILALGFALIMNALVGAQLIDVLGIKDISDKYATFLTPASYAFSIWSVIYLLLIVFVVYQARDLFKPSENNSVPQKTGLLFIIASIANGLWTFIFVKELIGLSVVVLFILTASLYLLLYKLRIAVYDAPRKVIACVWWPLLLYTGWVTVATVVNIASWLAARGIVISPAMAVVILVGLAITLLILLVKRNVRELLLASSWGIIAIGVGQTNDIVSLGAYIVGAVLLAACAGHAWHNRATNRFLKHI